MNDLQEAHSKFIQSYPWDTYFTITCRRPRKDASNLAYGTWRVLEKFGATRSFTAIESHPMGHGLHAHGLSRFADWESLDLGSLWCYSFKAFGRSEFGTARSMSDVSRYCAKYVTKNQPDGDYFYFGAKECWLDDNGIVEYIPKEVG